MCAIDEEKEFMLYLKSFEMICEMGRRGEKMVVAKAEGIFDHNRSRLGTRIERSR